MPTTPSGQVEGRAHRAEGTADESEPVQRYFGWEYTLDGKAFVAADPTAVAHTTIAGLPSLTVVGFRVRVVDSIGPGAWSQVVSLVIH